jgi:hypothetical protein
MDWLTDKLINYLHRRESFFWGTHSSSAGLEMHLHFMAPEEPLNCSEEPTTFSVLSHLNTVRTTKSYFFKIHCILILPSVP